jgi:methionine-rich copper-binding protein CopC
MAGHRLRRVSAVALGATVAIGAVLAFAAPAQAHDAVVASTPSPDETLTALPAEFSVTASQTIVAPEGAEANFGLRITDAAGLFYQDGCVSIVDDTMSTAAALGEAGAYTLTWQYVSSDGHPTSGTVPFTWSPPADFVPSAGETQPRVCGDEAPTASPVPEPEMTTQADEPSATPAPPAASDGDTGTTLLWLGGAALAIVVAIGATLLLVRPKKEPGDGPEAGTPPVV